jgi:two-component system, NarL family, response regulator LiaR
MTEPITVVVVDDHVLFRQGLRELLQQEEIRVVGEASNAEAGVELVQRHAPDVAIMDLNLPGASGHEAIRELTASAPRTRILVLTVSASEIDVTDAVLAGACGYLVKDASTSDIITGVRAAAMGESMISPSIAGTLLERLRQQKPDDQPAAAQNLSVREKEILRLVAEGKDNATIAQELFISPYTVKNHVSNILLKLHVENRIQAAVRAIRESMI